jgi:hypothetical protein
MKHRSLIPAFLWYAPVLTGWSYLIVFILFIILPGNPREAKFGDIIFCIGQLCVPFSMLLLHKLNLNGKGFWRKFSLFIPAVGSVSYLSAVLSVFIEQPIIILFPIGAFLSGLGMLIVGIQVVRSGQLKQWKRFTPLLVGLYPFLFMFPIVLATGSPSIYAILLWGIPWKIMGCALLSELYSWKRSMG